VTATAGRGRLAAAGQGSQEALAGGLGISRRGLDVVYFLKPLADSEQGLQVGRQVRVAGQALLYPGSACRQCRQAIL
jgi:hypothetical protein